MKSPNSAIVGAFVLLLAILAATTFLVAYDRIDGDAFMAVVIGPSVGGLIGFVAGTKGVQQGSAATASPPPDA